MQEEKIKAAIAEYLDKNLIAYYDGYTDTLGWKRFVPGMIPEIARDLYAAIVPHMAPSPDWSEAPEWATHLAQDQSGQWHWFKSEPRTEAGYWVAKGDTNARAFSKNPNWKETLEARPE